jgi:hypothetical protein
MTRICEIAEYQLVWNTSIEYDMFSKSFILCSQDLNAIVITSQFDGASAIVIEDLRRTESLYLD